MGRLAPSARFFLVALCCLGRGAASADAAAVEALIARAHAARLESDPQWLRLGHWQPRLLGGGVHSQAMGAFFLAQDGKTNPSAELDATLRGIFGLIPLTPQEVEQKVLPAPCRFPARTAWLLQKLQVDAAQLPQTDCPKLADYFRKLAPESASLVFSSYYLNNPSSAFGHVFLRIHRRFDGVSQEKRELLDYAIDYSASADTHNPVLYAMKGLTGLFRGDFHLFPFYYKVREYNDYEARDLWEYDLALAPQELGMLVAHLFELGSSWFPYYYIDENCAYQVLTALEAAVPRARLVDEVKVPVIPADTVKALYANPGLVKAVHYRPSAVTQFEARIATLPRSQRAAVRALAEDPETPLSGIAAADQIRVFDAAADLVDIRYARDLPFEPDGKGGQIKRRVLERRAGILQPSPDLDLSTPWGRQPQLAHGSARSGAAFGASDRSGPFTSLGWRLALHDLGDPAGGYPELAQIEFLPTQVRYYPRDRSLQLESFDLVNVLSLHALSLFDPALSWKMNFGAHRVRDGGCEGCLALDGRFGSGLAIATADEALAAFAFGDLSVEASPELRGLRQARAVRAGLGPMGGVRLRLFDGGVLLADAGWRWLPGAVAHQTWFAESSLRFQATRWLGVGIEARKDVAAAEASAHAFLYF